MTCLPSKKHKSATKFMKNHFTVKDLSKRTENTIRSTLRTAAWSKDILLYYLIWGTNLLRPSSTSHTTLHLRHLHPSLSHRFIGPQLKDPISVRVKLRTRRRNIFPPRLKLPPRRCRNVPGQCTEPKCVVTLAIVSRWVRSNVQCAESRGAPECEVAKW